MTPDGSLVMNNQSAMSNLGVSINLSEAIRSSATEQADKAYSAALSHQQSYNKAISAAERGVYELSRHQALSESSGASFVTSESASDMQALNVLQQDSQKTGQEHSASESAAHNRQFDVGLSGRVGVGVKEGGNGLSGSGNLGANWSWSHGQSEQHSFSQSENATDTTGYAHNIETVFRGVAEGSYRANTEEGKRILESISTSLDHAHQEQQQASAQFQQAQTYRQMASISEEQAASINANATQEFMNELQKEQGLRSIEKTMVNRPEQGQVLAKAFIQEKVQHYFQEFSAAEASSPERIHEVDQENKSSIDVEEKSKAPKILYAKEQDKIKSSARQDGLDQTIPIDKRPAEGVGKVIVEKNFEIEGSQKQLKDHQGKIVRQVKENQRPFNTEVQFAEVV